MPELISFIAPIAAEYQQLMDTTELTTDSAKIGRAIAALMLGVTKDEEIKNSVAVHFSDHSESQAEPTLEALFETVAPDWRPTSWAEMAAVLPLLELGFALTDSSDTFLNLLQQWVNYTQAQHPHWDMDTIRTNLDRDFLEPLPNVSQVLALLA